MGEKTMTMQQINRLMEVQPPDTTRFLFEMEGHTIVYADIPDDLADNQGRFHFDPDFVRVLTPDVADYLCDRLDDFKNAIQTFKARMKKNPNAFPQD